MIRIAVTSQGRLKEQTLQLLRDCGYRTDDHGRRLVWTDAEHGIEFYLLRGKDIPVYVESGVFSAGITGLDSVAERDAAVRVLVPLGIGAATLRVAAPAHLDPSSVRIATSYPHITARAFPDATIVDLSGSVEAAVTLGVADAVVDLVQTGETLRQAGLQVIGEPILVSEAALIVGKGSEAPSEVQVLARRLAGRTIASRYVMVEYDVPEPVLAAACEVTPGFESPTVAPLQEAGWFAVRSMVPSGDTHRVLDKLAELGCEGIVVTRIEHLRSSREA